MAATFALSIGYLLLAGVLAGCVWALDSKTHQRLKPMAALTGAATLLFMFTQHLQVLAGIFILLLILMSTALPFIFNTLTHQKGFLFAALKFALIIFMVLTCFALAAHLIPGIKNTLLHENIIISESAGTINIKANIDKALAGILLLFLIMALKLKPQDPYSKPARQLSLIPLYISLVLIVAYLSGLHLDIKMPPQTLSFVVTNLFFSVIAEEALFRGILQNCLSQFLKDKTRFSAHLGLIITSLMFGLAHIGGGWHFVILATFAGLLYGWVYQKSGQLSLAILTHWGVNVGHFLLLVYPVPK